jgi:hypothetical protein
MIDSVIMDTKELGQSCSQIYTTSIRQYSVMLTFDLRKQLKFIEVNPLFD